MQIVPKIVHTKFKPWKTYQAHSQVKTFDEKEAELIVVIPFCHIKHSFYNPLQYLEEFLLFTFSFQIEKFHHLKNCSNEQKSRN